MKCKDLTNIKTENLNNKISQKYVKIINNCEKVVKNNHFSIGFHSKIYEILVMAFCIFPITLGRVDPQQ